MVWSSLSASACMHSKEVTGDEPHVSCAHVQGSGTEGKKLNSAHEAHSTHDARVMCVHTRAAVHRLHMSLALHCMLFVSRR